GVLPGRSALPRPGGAEPATAHTGGGARPPGASPGLARSRPARGPGEPEPRVPAPAAGQARHRRARQRVRRRAGAPAAGLEPRLAAALLDTSPTEAGELLGRLVDEQVLELVGDSRYGFHDLIALFAEEKLDLDEPRPARDAALERALRLYLQAAARRAALLDP